MHVRKAWFYPSGRTVALRCDRRGELLSPLIQQLSVHVHLRVHVRVPGAGERGGTRVPLFLPGRPLVPGWLGARSTPSPPPPMRTVSGDGIWPVCRSSSARC